MLLVDRFRRTVDIRSEERTLTITVHDLIDEGMFLFINKPMLVKMNNLGFRPVLTLEP